PTTARPIGPSWRAWSGTIARSAAGCATTVRRCTRWAGKTRASVTGLRAQRGRAGTATPATDEALRGRRAPLHLPAGPVLWPNAAPGVLITGSRRSAVERASSVPASEEQRVGPSIPLGRGAGLGRG